MSTEIAAKADFSQIRYAQCWEDADVLLEALDIQPSDTCLSIASAGDNTLAMLSKSPRRVIAIDMNSAQLASLELRVAAYRNLDHGELIELMGSRPSNRRRELYSQCRQDLSSGTRLFWDAHTVDIDAGIGGAGKFERYFAMFRTYLLPIIHSKRTIAELMTPKSRSEREDFYAQRWNNIRWRMLFRIFFSRWLMGRLGRDPSFFKYVEGYVSKRILERTRYALTQLDIAENPYAAWILTGQHKDALPYSLRTENFDSIRDNLGRLEWQQCSVEDFLDDAGTNAIDKYNLSDIFEYMSQESYVNLLERLVNAAKPGGRLVYWNMLAKRRRPESMAESLVSLDDLARSLFSQDKAFFYSDFVIEEVAKNA